MGSEIDSSGKLDDVMNVSPSIVEDGKPSMSPKEELGNCESNREDDVFHMEGVVGVHDNGDARSGKGEELEVDVVGDMVFDEGEEGMVERDSPDATECSSSFGCTDSGRGTAEASGDMEVESIARDDNTMLMEFDGCNDLFRTRKKKLTVDWREYVRPLMWRCKWVELHIRELQSQAAKYARELAECDKRKQCELEQFSNEDHAMKSSLFMYHPDQRVKLLKRKKRKRVEEAADLASYTTRHSLFSYFASKKSGADTAYVGDDLCHAGRTPFGSGEFDVDCELTSLQFKDNDAFESILRKIEEAQVHVRQLRMRMDKVVRENAEKFGSDYSSFAPRDQSTSCDPNSVPPHVNGEPGPLGSMPTTSQWSSKKLLMPETAVSIVEEATPPDMIKTIDDPQIGVKCETIENAIVLSNLPVKEEFDTNEDGHVQLLAESPSEPEVKPEIVQHVPDPVVTSQVKMHQEQQTFRMQSSSKMTFPENKKKRGRRKARTGRWSKRSSG